MKTKTEQIDAANPDEKILEHAVSLLKRGEVVVCPTDTGYAFSANALDTRAITRVFHLKGRAYSNPIHIAVTSMAEAQKYAHVTEAAKYLAVHYLPGALTMVLKKRETIPSLLVAGLDTVGIRIPDSRVILRLVEMAGCPLTTTSANISGKPGTYSIQEVPAQLGENIQQVAMILDQGPLKQRELSTIVDMTASPPELIRQGRISWLDIHGVLKMFQDAFWLP